MKIINFKTIIAVLFFGLICSLSSAATSNDEASNFIKNTSDQVISILNSSEDEVAKEKKLTGLFVEIMDVDWIGKYSLGKYWSELNDQDKIKYLQAHRKYLISSYVPLFKRYNNQKIIIKSIEPRSNDQYTVVSQIQGEQSYNVAYRLKHVNGRFKVRDIIAEDVSLLSTQRSGFASIISQGGIDNLNEKLLGKTN